MDCFGGGKSIELNREVILKYNLARIKIKKFVKYVFAPVAQWTERLTSNQ
jgi:hypothetical protein